jgi:hypothetical protein
MLGEIVLLRLFFVERLLIAFEKQLLTLALQLHEGLLLDLLFERKLKLSAQGVGFGMEVMTVEIIFHVFAHSKARTDLTRRLAPQGLKPRFSIGLTARL